MSKDIIKHQFFPTHLLHNEKKHWLCSQLGFSLICNGFLSSLELSLIKQVVVLKRSHVLIELEDKGAGRGNVVRQNFLFVHASQVLDNGSQRVAVGHDNDSLAVHDLGADLVIPVGQDAVDGDLEWLCGWENIRRQGAIPAVELGVSLVVQVELSRGDVVGTAPFEHLLLAVLLGSLRLVESLEGSIVALFETVRLVVGDPKGTHLSG